MTKTLELRRFIVKITASVFSLVIFAVLFCTLAVSADEINTNTGFKFTNTECFVYSSASDTDAIYKFDANTKLFCYGNIEGYTKVYVNGKVGYVISDDISEERTWTERRFEDRFINKNGVDMYAEADESSAVISKLDINDWIIAYTDNGEWIYVNYNGKKGYVKLAFTSETPCIANGFVTDESLSKEELDRVNAYVDAHFSLVPEIWTEFCKSDWEYHITTKPVKNYLEDADIETKTELPENMCGLTVLNEKIIVSSVKGHHLEIAVIHELGHYVFRCWLTAGERTEFSKIYNDFIKRQLNDVAEYTYTNHCVENASEFFAESFQRYLIGIVEHDGNASEIENLTPEVRSFIEAHI